MALESVDGADERLRHVLHLLRVVVPAERIVVSWQGPDSRQLLVVPEASPSERARVGEEVARSLRLMEEGRHDPATDSTDARHLALPITGLDRLLGLLRVEAAVGTTYDVDHLRVLSIVAAQLGGYVNTLHLTTAATRRTKALAEAHELQQLLIGIVTHDLRSPLFVIATGTAGLLARAEEPHLTRSLSRILSSARRAERIVNDLLDATRARVHGVLSLSRRQADLRNIAEQVVEDLRLAYPASQLRLVVDPSVPCGDWDPERLVQAITNLVTNSVQHGAPERPISVRVEGRGDRAVISVHNEGPPIPAELLPILFDPFKRRQSRGSGLGLGLYIVSEIVRAHGGRIDVESAAAGTTFSVELPAGTSVATASRPRPSKDHPLVLVVEDHPDIRSTVVELLESEGLRSAEAADGGRAVELTTALRPDLVIMDLGLPVLDGLQATRQIRACSSTRDIPVLVFSATSGSFQEAFDAGCTAALSKTASLDALRREVIRLVGKSA